MDLSHPAYFIPFLVVLWCGVCFLVAALSGWSRLAAVYERSGEFEGQRWRLQNGQMRLLMGYHNCLTVGSNGQGLSLSMLFLFRLGHPPLFIPWNDISIRQRRYLWIRGTEFRFRQAPSVSLWLAEALVKRIAAAAAAAWPGLREAPEPLGE